MNSHLKNRVFDIPQEVLDVINHTITGLNGKNIGGTQRAKKLLQDRKVKYGQLKRIIHDLENTDRTKDSLRYNLYGGEKMKNWAKTYLKGERDLITNRKESKRRADSITNMDGIRKNSYLSTHNKDFSFTIPTNMMKSNSQKTSVSKFKSFKLFEEINKIKNLIKY